jgi:3-hydroxyacyl-CoA dehydrogenase
MNTRRHAVILGMGLMGCDIAAIFLAGGWRVSAVETARARWTGAEARVRASIGQLDGNPDGAEHLTLFDAIEAPAYASAEIVVEVVRPFRERVHELMADPAELRRLMTIGAHKARATAAATLDDVYQRVGFVPIDRD